MSPKARRWKGAFRPLLPDVRAIDFNDFDQLRLITRRTACVVVEPVQGEAGVRPPVPGWLEALRRRCDEVGALLVFDEIQTGMGRTGEMFAMCKYGVTPDIVCLAKAFGGGMPLGAFVSRKEIMDTLQTAPTLGHITTFGGHPVCCAAGLAALEYLLETGTVEHVEGRGVLYESLLADHPQVVEIRRSGLLLAVELGSSAKMFRMMEALQGGGHPERLVPLLRYGVPHLAAAHDHRGGSARQRPPDPRMPRPNLTANYRQRSNETSNIQQKSPRRSESAPGISTRSDFAVSAKRYCSVIGPRATAAS